jgi:DNA (cytosine-5)-methyltransferase 1
MRTSRKRSTTVVQTIELKHLYKKIEQSPISAVDLFCGAGGLTHGLLQAGIKVEAGIDIDKLSEHAYTANNPGAKFLDWDVSRKNYTSIEKLFDDRKIRLLAGCAPCQPFSKLTRAIERHQAWNLLDNFARFVVGIQPELVTMENVPELADRGKDVFNKFVSTLENNNYAVDWKIVRCEEYGIPQSRRRLVLLASKLGHIEVPNPCYPYKCQWKTVRDTISKLGMLESGQTDPNDPLHTASKLSPQNIKRIKATRIDGGTRQDWPEELVLECHKKKSGERYFSIYGRMWWDKPAPTMTTLCTGLGNGRFGHPEQDRSITLREASLFQSFPGYYNFWPNGQKLNKGAISRMIGNAVPPGLAKVLGTVMLRHVKQHKK